ncbi:MAG TPA: arsenosugar biosynthesis radical SAM (seleno)protein ArsS [Vicinamibacteria bacterium]|nr:arsenosugar biosynthesis radical SAM (seleno)protein ArsS [Vicinamibacteria bacterium]
MSRTSHQELVGPRGTTSLRSRAAPLAEPRRQIAVLQAVNLGDSAHAGNFDETLAHAGHPRLGPTKLEIFQINVGKLCNMTCKHCHVDAGPDRVEEQMNRETAEACMRALDRTKAHTVDITGGAPELNPNFSYLVEESVGRGKHVIDRCNLTVLLLPRFRDLPDWLAERSVEIVASLPHWRRRNTDSQRGEGTFDASIQAIRRLNVAGYGRGDDRKRLTLMVNPVGAFLAGSQTSLEREWKEGLEREHGVCFDRLIALNNMPISRFLEWLDATRNLRSYLELLVRKFNPATVSGLMCRNTLSVSWDGRLFDCDFNQMLELPIVGREGRALNVRDLDRDRLASRRIVTGRHCYGCTAGAGSSCGGSLSGDAAS